MFNLKNQTHNGLLIGEGYRLTDRTTDGRVPSFQKIYIPDQDRKGHTWCFGTTRIGKTKVMENMIEQDIKSGRSVIVIDPKGDIDLLSKIVQVSDEEKRLKQLMFMTPIHPEHSIHIDPLAYYYMPEELVGHIVSGVDVGRDKFYYNVAYELSLVVVQALILTGRRKESQYKRSFNLNDVKNKVSKDELVKLRAEVDEFRDDPDPDIVDYATQLSQDMDKIINSPTDYYSKISANLRVALMELTSGHIGRIIGTAHGNKFISRLEKDEPVILVVHLASLITKQAAYTLGKVIISMIQSFIGRRFADGRKATPPLCVYMDEAQNLLFLGIDDFFAKAGGANVWVHGFSQSISQIYSQIGKDYGNAILDNTNTKLFMRVPDATTATYVAEHFGMKTKYQSILDGNGGITVRELENEVVKPTDVLNLKERVFFLMTYNGAYKGKSIEVLPPRFQVRFPETGVVHAAN